MSAPLKHLIRPSAGDAALTLILLHGVGSNEEDLFSLESAFPPEWRIISVRAPLTMRPGSYAWFPVQFTPEGPVIDPVAAETSRALLLEFLDWAAAEYGVEPRSTVIGGFSQGAILSASVALTKPEAVKAAVLMSGRILPEVLPLAVDSTRLNSVRFLIVHGTQDDRLPLAHGKASRETLRSLGVEPEYREFSMAHTITDESLSFVRSWVVSLS